MAMTRTPQFGAAGPLISRGGGGSFEFASLPDNEKLRLCEGLLQEFGAQRVSIKASGEIIHSCVLPFGGHTHGDSSPSASLNYKKLTYSCLGCGSSGGLLWFIGVCRGLESVGAREWLAKQTGIGGVQDLNTIMTFIDGVIERMHQGFEAVPIPKFDKRILTPWKLIHPYLTEDRKIPEENIIKHTVGFDGWRIIIPHFWRDDLVGWQARRLAPSDGGPKYRNTPDFPRESTIYNFDSKAPRTIIVESPMSVIARTHQCHMEATFGAAIGPGQLRALSKHGDIVLFFDPDKAGWKGTRILGDELSKYTSKIFVAANPYFDADPADLDDTTFATLIDGAVHYSLWTPPHSDTLRSWRLDEEVRNRQGAAG
jgi:CHC2 zinc finger